MQLFIPGPVSVAPDVAAAQTLPMIGHRGADFENLFARIQPKLRQVFATQSRVYISTSSGTGLQEAAVRNCVRRRCLNLVNGAFSERWHEITLANGKEGIKLEAPWGRAIHPEQVAEALAQGDIDAVTVVHNETSTAVMNPLADIAAVVRRYPDVLLLVDAVSSLGGVAIDCDALGLDVLLTSSQKCFGLPPGLSFCAVSDRALERARTIPYRGYYFDFVELEKYLVRNQTPATPAISLLFALDVQLDRMLAEGLAARYARHSGLAATVHAWATDRYALFAEEGYRSLTVTTVTNTRKTDIGALNRYLRGQGMVLSDGYGRLKGQTFRIAHMGETTSADIERLLAAIDAFLGPA